MPCSACLSTFASLPEDNSRAAAVDVAHPDCACERHQVSEHSSVPVSAEETLVRLVMNPDHVHTENGITRLRSSFFSDAKTAGASCIRKDHASPDEYILTINKILAERPTAPTGEPRKIYGVVVMPVSELKAIQHNLSTSEKSPDLAIALCVYATAEADRPNHADVMVNHLGTISGSKANRALTTLSKKSQEFFKTPEEFKSIVDLTAWAA
jgi:hypothetical protein